MKREDLAFTIEDRGGIMVLQYDNGGCHPANDNEIAMWELIRQLEEHCAVQKDIIEQYQRADKGEIQNMTTKALLIENDMLKGENAAQYCIN